MNEIIEKARACYLECEQMDSDGIVETIAKYIKAETVALEDENDRMMKVLKDVIRFGWPANVETNPVARMLGGKKPSTADVWTFPKHMLPAIEAIIAEAKP